MISLSKILSTANVAELLSENELNEISMKVCMGYETDKNSRADWMEMTEKVMALANAESTGPKNDTIDGGSNVKYPLIKKAAVDFSARLYPAIVQNNRVVRCEVIGADPDKQKFKRATRVADHMSYQRLHQQYGWEENTDKLLQILAVTGIVFRKVYYDHIEKYPRAELCRPEKVVVNYNTTCLEDARRITHALDKPLNFIVSNVRTKRFLPVDFEAMAPDQFGSEEKSAGYVPLLEQHTFLDLDGDGYEEPYIVTLHEDSKQVLSIVKRFNKQAIRYDNKKVYHIVPEQYFVDYHCIPSADGGFYSNGFGTLLYQNNEIINTTFNQLMDAGTLANSQGGFIGRGLRIKGGTYRHKRGEWTICDAAAGTNIQQNVVPFPTKEPSAVLFQLLTLLNEESKELVSTHDLMQGKGQTQNVAATTVMAMLEQGMKVYSAISKRIYRSLKKEYRRIFELNQRFPDPRYQQILDDPEADVKADYDALSYDIVPIADPTMSTKTQRLAKAQALLSLPGVNAYEAQKYYMEQMELEPNLIERLLPEPDPNAPPPPEQLKLMAETEKLKMEAQAKNVEAQVLSENQLMQVEKLSIEQGLAQVQAQEAISRIRKSESDASVNEAKLQLLMMEADHEAKMRELQAVSDREAKEAELAIELIKADLQRDTEEMKAREGRKADKE